MYYVIKCWGEKKHNLFLFGFVFFHNMAYMLTILWVLTNVDIISIGQILLPALLETLFSEQDGL